MIAAAKKELATRKLLYFTTYTKADYEVNWHHRLLCEKLDLWAAGEIPRLMVFMPPRHGKSELVSRRLPAFMLGRNPDLKVIAASYGADLARMMNRDVQRIIDGDPFQSLFPNTRLFGKNIRTMAGHTYLRNSDLFEIVGHYGHYKSSGVGGAIMGMGADRAIIDDPIKNKAEAKSPVYRQSVWQWYTTTFRTRLQSGGAILITLTRWHEDDLAGRLIELAKSDPAAEQWEILSLPAIKVGAPSDYDPRSDGEALWPSHYNQEALSVTKATIEDDEWNALYQQSPTAPAGSIFKRVWWHTGRYDWHDPGLKNAVVARWISFDTALKENEENDPTAYTVAELWADYRLAIRRVETKRLEFPDLTAEITTVAHLYNTDGKLKGVIIEDKASGTSALQTLTATAPEWLRPYFIPFLPTTDKISRAKQAAVWCKNGSVLLPMLDLDLLWLAKFEDELFSFPKAKHDDQVDSFSQLILYLEHILEEGYRTREGSKT